MAKLNSKSSVLGGRIKLSTEKARLAMAKIADGLGSTIEEAAVAVLRVGDAAMVNALKLVSVQRGHDPRNFVLVATGGGGPMQAATLGQEIGVREIIIPRYPGYASAWGHARDRAAQGFCANFFAACRGYHD
jgi:N-methylhydantoinase A